MPRPRARHTHARLRWCHDVGKCHKSAKGERIAQGREKARAFVAEHPEVVQEVRLTLIERASHA